MKIAIISSLYSPHAIGGAERVAQIQAETLAERGHSVHVLTLGAAGSPAERTSINGVDVARVPIENLYLPVPSDRATLMKVAWHGRDVYNRSMAGIARRSLAELRPQLVISHNIAGWSAAVWPAAKSLGLPLVHVLHDQYLRCVRSNMFKADRCATPCLSCQVMRLPHKRLSHLPDAVVGVSRYVLDSHVEAGYFHAVPRRTHIHNVSHIDTRARGTPALAGAETVFGFIGVLSPGKGIELLLAAFLAAAGPHWRLLVAGTGEAHYVRYLRATYSDPRIQFMGRQEPGDFYQMLDATVVPSLLDEALGNVVFESMIHGRGVIAARRGGIPEMVHDGVTGMLFEPQNEGELGRVLQRVSADVEGWRTRNPDIKAMTTPYYCDREAWIRRWEELFQNVAGS
jgi:glycosyltransferase involved in cell wall biosynthesis